MVDGEVVMRRDRRSNACVVLAVALAAGLSGCGGSAAGPDALSPGGDVVAPRADPTVLVDSWYVEAPGEEEGAALIIGDRVDGAMLLFRRCGTLDGDWRANGQGMFIAYFSGGSGACFDEARDGGPDPLDGWWNSVVGFRGDGDEMLLTDAAGETLARLSPGAHPTTGPDESEEYASPPVLTPDLREKLAEPAPLPDGVTAATSDDVLGRWIPSDAGGSTSFITFEADQSYEGSDGCNGAGGRYLVGQGGVLLITSGASTAIGCEGSGLAHSVSGAGRVGLRHGHLVFVDPDGKVIGEAARPDRM